jgi:cytochrome oxidase assembly protein ShyY1
MNETARKPRVAGFALFTLFLTAVCIVLGVWQLQRRIAKHELIAALTERLAEAPVALPPPARWAALSPARDEFRRVSFTATYAPLPDAMVYSPGSAVRKDASGPGTWAFLPARLPSGETVVIDAGFVENTMQDRSVEDRAVKKLVTGQAVSFTGYLSTLSSRRPRTAFRGRDRSTCISRTITCNTPSPGSRLQAPCSSPSPCGQEGGGGAELRRST